ncbi:MAG: YafY family transcriptional regulator [Bacteroidetes bacterium]|nr:YafY family transcriptional regulator [Bacteroidota bacterium]
MNRTDRLFAILLEIQSNPSITSAKLAERFDVTKRTIYRDVLALMEANVPVHGKAGEGYTIDDDYFLPPVSFTKDEALLLILGADAVGQQFDAQYKKAARSAENKIHASLSKSLKKEVVYLKSYITFFSGMQNTKGNRNDAMHMIRRAIMEKKSLAFRYYKRYSETTEPMVREVDPYALTNFYGNWAMSGYDHLRKDLRMFRLDRMEAVLVTSKAFERPKNFRFSQLAREDQSVKSLYQIKIDRTIFRWIKEQPPYRIIKTQSKKNHVVLTIESSSESAIITWLLRWGDKAEALSPSTFRTNVRSTLTKLLNLYE